MSNLFPPIPQQETTGRFLVVLNDDSDDAAGASMNLIANATGVSNFAHSADFSESAPTADQLGETPIVFDELGIAVVSLEPQQAQSLQAAASGASSLVTLEPERVVYAIGDMTPQRLSGLPDIGAAGQISVSPEYLKGYRDAVNKLVDQLMDAEPSLEFADGGSGDSPDSMAAFTWGLQATKADVSAYSGSGIKVAVLDTGLDPSHPDYNGRLFTNRSFIEGESAKDENGHGTHCIGTACGSKCPASLPRYGVAHNAYIYSGKVLSNAGAGADGGILAGINWAIANGCAVISMSLGARTLPGQSYSRVYEKVGKRALRRGSLIIAASGNDSWRQVGLIFPVSHPANCPSIMAIGALDSRLRIAQFSNGGIKGSAGQIDLAAPGVDVYSSWPMPTQYNSISGTSMATPHVAGIAALYAEATGARGSELWAQLIQNAQRLSLPSRDVGSGLATAI